VPHIVKLVSSIVIFGLLSLSTTVCLASGSVQQTSQVSVSAEPTEASLVIHFKGGSCCSIRRYTQCYYSFTSPFSGFEVNQATPVNSVQFVCTCDPDLLCDAYDRPCKPGRGGYINAQPNQCIWKPDPEDNTKRICEDVTPHNPKCI
jgi:hypothetical protein